MGQIIESQVAKENWYALLLAIEKRMSGKEALMQLMKMRRKTYEKGRKDMYSN